MFNDIYSVRSLPSVLAKPSTQDNKTTSNSNHLPKTQELDHLVDNIGDELFILK